MPNLEQSQDAHTATDHSVTRERAVEIQRLVYKSKIKGIRYSDVWDTLGVECNNELFQNYKKKLSQSVCVGAIANRDVLTLFKSFFKEQEFNILMQFAKPERLRSNSVVHDIKFSVMDKEEIHKIKKIRRKLLYQELYSKGL